MSDSFLDGLPSHERGRWERLKLRSPGEYEKLRKAAREHGPAFAEREMKHNAEFAEMKFSLETDSNTQEQAKDAVSAAMSEKGIDAVADRLPVGAKEAITKGQFDVVVDTTGHEPKLAVKPKKAPKDKHGGGHDATSGNVAEVFSLKPSLQQQIVSTFTLRKGK